MCLELELGLGLGQDGTIFVREGLVLCVFRYRGFKMSLRVGGASHKPDTKVQFRVNTCQPPKPVTL